MKLIKKPVPKYVGWWLACQCGAICEVDSDEEIQVHTSGDYKDEGLLKWLCPHCRRENFDTYSHMRTTSLDLQKKYGGR